jgi:branched-chain amino acid transport system permease protein
MVVGWFPIYGISMLNGLAIGSLLFTMAVGLSLIFGLVQVLNLAHGSLFLIGAYVGYALTENGTPGGLLIAVLLGAALGAVAGWLLSAATRRLPGNLDQALLTLGLSFIIADSVSTVWGKDVHSVKPPSLLAGAVSIGGSEYPLYRVVIIGVGIALAIAVYLVFERTRLGALARAAVADSEMLSALGVRTRRIVLGVFLIGGALAAVGGALAGPVLGAYPGEDSDVLILTLTVVVIGGLGSIPGAFVGAIFIGELQSLGVALLPQVASLLVFVAMAAVLAVRPQGLFGKPSLIYK